MVQLGDARGVGMAEEEDLHGRQRMSPAGRADVADNDTPQADAFTSRDSLCGIENNNMTMEASMEVKLNLRDETIDCRQYYIDNSSRFHESDSESSKGCSESSPEESSINDEDETSITDEDEEGSAVALSDEEVQNLLDQLLQVESEAAEAQEALEEESIERVKQEVIAELSETVSRDELDAAVSEEMAVFTKEWENALASLEEQSALLQEWLEDAGMSLPEIFKSIEKQASEGCCTEAWKRRVHWAGAQMPQDFVEVISTAEEILNNQWPVKRRSGRLVEEGASGYLKRKFKRDEFQATELTPDTESRPDADWHVLENVLAANTGTGFRGPRTSNEWIAVYTASTPEEAARLGLDLPGVNKVEEIGDIDVHKVPAYAAALEEESAHGLTERQKNSLKRVREEDDARKSRWMNKNVIWKRSQPEYTRKKVRKDRPKWKNSDISFTKNGGVGTSDMQLDTGCALAERHASLSSEFSILSKDARTCETGPLKLSENQDVVVLSDDEGDFKDVLEMGNCKGSKNHLILTKDCSIHPLDKTNSATVPENVKQEDGLLSPQDRAVIDIFDNGKEGEAEGIPMMLRRHNSLSEKKQIGSRHRRKTKVCVIDTDSDRDDKGSMDKESFETTDLECGDSLPVLEQLNDQPVAFRGPLTKRNLVGDTEVTTFKSSKKRLRQGKHCFQCSVCFKALAKVQVLRHSLLEVIVCKDCRSFYESGQFSKDEDGWERECRWCGEGGKLVCCDFCDKAFCEQCISGNLGEHKLREFLHMDWKCFLCDSSPLLSCAHELREAKWASDSQQAESDNDDVTGADDVDVMQPRKLSRRRNIRKVMDDEELNEQTKLKILLEKERQERLQKWYEGAKENNTKKIPNNLITRAASQTRQADDEHHEFCDDDCKVKGCIINGARASTEDIVRIPLSICKFLRPHQLSGVRFMWENCIESVAKVKSGDTGLGCILAHNMGLGKTLQVIAFLYTIWSNTDLGLKTVLVVVPVNVLYNWRSEFLKWLPKEANPIPLYLLDDVGRNNLKRAKLLNQWQNQGGVMVIGYAAFRMLSLGKHVRDKSTRDVLCNTLQNPGPDILICDEAHMIKNSKTNITQALKQVRSQRRIALTGSPLQNNLMEYYCMVDFVREGFLGNAKDFRNRFQNPIENGQHADSTIQDVKTMKQRAHVLHQQLKGFVQRKDLTVLKHELPSKSVWVISVRLSELQRRLYTKFLELHECYKTNGRLQGSFLFSVYHSLAKIWNHPDLLWLAKEKKDAQGLDDNMEDFIVDTDEENLSEDDNSDLTNDIGKGRITINKRISGLDDIHEVPEWWKDILDGNDREVVELSGKMILLLRLLSMSSSYGDKALVFSQSLHTLDLIERFLEKFPCFGGNGHWKRGREWYRLDGTTSSASRQQIVERFNDANNVNVQCVLISTRAGSLGINLTAANRVIIVDGSWNPTHDLQALFRVWRFGQTKPVHAYRLLAFGTMEEKIYNRQLTKEGLAARVIDEHQVGRHLNEKDLAFLFTLDDDPDGSLYSVTSINSETMKDQTAMIRTNPNFDQLDQPSSSEPLSNVTDPLVSSKRPFLGFATPGDAPPRDEFMAMLLLEYRPRWIAKYHEHEPLLEDLEDEKLTEEEQIQAWEAFRRGHEEASAETSTHPVGGLLQFDGRGSGAIPPNYILGNGLPFSSCSQTKASPCVAAKHVLLLTNLKAKMGDQVFCTDCMNCIGWEHLVKKRRNNSMMPWM